MSFYLCRRSNVGCILMVLLIVNIGCRGWIEKPIVPDTGIGMPQHGLLRVTKTDGAIITLRDFVVRDDSIVGFFSDGPRLRATVARTDVTKIQVRGATPRGVRIAGKIIYLAVFCVSVVELAVVVYVLSPDLKKVP